MIRPFFAINLTLLALIAAAGAADKAPQPLEGTFTQSATNLWVTIELRRDFTFTVRGGNDVIGPDSGRPHTGRYRRIGMQIHFMGTPLHGQKMVHAVVDGTETLWENPSDYFYYLRTKTVQGYAI